MPVLGSEYVKKTKGTAKIWEHQVQKWLFWILVTTSYQSPSKDDKLPFQYFCGHVCFQHFDDSVDSVASSYLVQRGIYFV